MDNAMSGLNGLVEKALPIAEWMMKIGGGLTLLALIYLALQLFGGRTTAMALGTPLWSNINLATSLFGPLAILAALGAIFVIWEQKGAGIALSVLGLGLFIGAPIVLGKQFNAGNGSVAGYAATQLMDACRIAGFGITAIGLLKWLIEVVVWLMEMPDRMKQKADVGKGQGLDPKQQRVARDANMFSPCWSLPFCREVIRKQCPAYLARKRCWKFKRGCYCDDEMIARIIRGDSLEKILAPTKMSQLRKPPCKRCYIYLEHQTHKFKVMSPLAVPLTIMFMFAIWNPFTTVFRPAYQKMDTWQKNLHLFSAPDPFQADAKNKEEARKIGEIDPEQVITYSQTMLGMLIGFFALIYISKFIEWAVFEAKL